MSNSLRCSHKLYHFDSKSVAIYILFLPSFKRLRHERALMNWNITNRVSLPVLFPHPPPKKSSFSLAFSSHAIFVLCFPTEFTMFMASMGFIFRPDALSSGVILSYSSSFLFFFSQHPWQNCVSIRTCESKCVSGCVCVCAFQCVRSQPRVPFAYKLANALWLWNNLHVAAAAMSYN